MSYEMKSLSLEASTADASLTQQIDRNFGGLEKWAQRFSSMGTALTGGFSCAMNNPNLADVSARLAALKGA